MVVPLTLPQLTTSRLYLRALTVEDAPAIFDYASDPEVSRYTLWEPHQNLSDSLAFIQAYAFKRYTDGDPEPFGIGLKSEPERVIGTIGCFWVSQQHKTMELAYAISRDYWGQGLIVEAGRSLLEYVFSQFDVERIQCRCKIENLASARVMEKLGFQKEGVLRSQVFHRKIFWDMHCTSILRSDFSGAHR